MIIVIIGRLPHEGWRIFFLRYCQQVPETEWLQWKHCFILWPPLFDMCRIKHLIQYNFQKERLQDSQAIVSTCKRTSSRDSGHPTADTQRITASLTISKGSSDSELLGFEWLQKERGRMWLLSTMELFFKKGSNVSLTDFSLSAGTCISPHVKIRNL